MSFVKDQSSGESSPVLDLSILVVTYNSDDTIDDCIQSLADDCKGLRTEIIVVDNHSSDNTPQRLKQLSEKHPEMSLILNTQNHGFAVGNNLALDRATGEHVLILNPDTVVHPGSMNGLLKALEQDQKTGVVAPKMVFPDGRTQRTCRRFPRHSDVIYNTFGLAHFFPRSPHFNAWKMGDFDHETPRQVDQPAGAALMIRGSVLREMEGFDTNFPMFFNDVDLCKRIKDAGHEIWFLPEFVLDHVGGASVKKFKFKMTISSHVSFFRYFEKHFTRLYQQPMNFLVGILLYLSLIPRLIILGFTSSPRNNTRDTL